MILKCLFLSDTWQALSLHAHCSGLRVTGLQTILPGGKTLSPTDCFSRKMVLKRPFFSDTGEVSALWNCSGLPWRRSFNSIQQLKRCFLGATGVPDFAF